MVVMRTKYDFEPSTIIQSDMLQIVTDLEASIKASKSNEQTTVRAQINLAQILAHLGRFRESKTVANAVVKCKDPVLSTHAHGGAKRYRIAVPKNPQPTFNRHLP
jgi:hypothetical protein